MPDLALTLFDYAASVATPPACAPSQTPTVGFLLSKHGRALATTWKARAIDNIAAIRLAQELHAGARAITDEDRAVLARYIGFGATELAQGLFPVGNTPVRAGWESISADLHALVGESERASLARSTQYAHYTPDYLSHALFDAAARLGFTGGAAIEPGCGIGLLMAAAPADLAARTTWTAIEMDPTSAMIARLLHPGATIRTQDFTKARFHEIADLVIANPPFAATHVAGEGPAGRLKLRLHDYFIARSLELLRPGGLGIFITSHGTMDKTDPKARAYMSTRASLIGAIRLPHGSMSEQAGTDVVIDLLFFRAGTTDTAPAAPWLQTVEIAPSSGAGKKPLCVNEYFAANPAMVLGKHDWTSSPFGPTYTCRPHQDGTLQQQLARAIDALPTIAAQRPALASADLPTRTPALTLVSRAADALPLFGEANTQPTTVPGASKTTRASQPAALTPEEIAQDARAYELKEGSYTNNGQLAQYVDGCEQPVTVKNGRSTPGIYPKAARTIAAYILVRNALRAVITAQVQDSETDNARAQERLRKAYALFVHEFGPINLTNITYHTDPDTGVESATQRHPNLAPVLEDPDCWLVASIERYNTETRQATMGPIFTERVIGVTVEPTIETIDDALAAILDRHGRVDIDAIAAALHIDRDEAIAQLGDRVYALPEAPGSWVTADEYLSGSVRAKLTSATVYAADDARLQRNVAALEAAQPQDLNPSDVTARLGSPWIPTSDIEVFVNEVMGIQTTVNHTVGIAAWDVNLSPFANETAATSAWGTARRHAGQLLHDALNGVIPQIYDVHKEDGREVRVLNPVDTEAAREKLAKIQEAFAGWIWQDNERTVRLMRVYNDTYNDLVPRAFDGSHLQLRGASNAVTLYAHQKRVIWRIVSSGSTYIAHSVGAGKTMSIAAAVMEQRRLGLVTKPILVVPGHCLAQFTIEWLQLYPTAKLLVADESNFASSKRARFVARATTGNWDCIIITHSAFKLIASPTKFEQQMIDEQLANLEAMTSALKEKGGGDRTSRKRLEQRKDALRNRLEALHGRKDTMVTIAEIGIDQIIVDEAQAFRKLSYTTNGGNIKGIDPDGSQRAWDLYVKAKYVQTLQPKRALILASGTPITNTLGEMYTVARYMNENDLYERNIHEFDAWKAMFGETVTELELQPSGQYKPVTRFAQFINVPELVAMFRTYADVVQRKDLRELIKLPAVAGGNRTIISGAATASFKAYQKYLAKRIHDIEQRGGKPEPGQDIILAVIGDGRHAAIDTRLVGEVENEDDNKLNELIRNVYRIYQETKDNVYTDRDGSVSPIRGAVQMIFSDLGTVAVAAKRGFSAYEWIRDELIRMGVPRREIAFMQDFKKLADKHEVISAFNRGEKRILLGSSETMGTGVNGQKRLKALHHLDVPWLPSEVEQREGRIERQGNENDEIEIYAYATPGSLDAQMWQTLERKSRFIGMAMSGDRSVRRLEDAGSQANTFAIAKAIASGNPLLMQKAGLESEIARLKRLRSAHFDDQHALNVTISRAKHQIADRTNELDDLTNARSRYRPTKGEQFSMTAFGTTTSERKTAGTILMNRAHTLPSYDYETVGLIGNLEVVGRNRRDGFSGAPQAEYGVVVGGTIVWTGFISESSPVGLVTRLEHVGQTIEGEIERTQLAITRAERHIAEATPRLGRPFDHQAELDLKLDELKEIERLLVAESERIDKERREEEEAAKRAAEAHAADHADDAPQTTAA